MRAFPNFHTHVRIHTLTDFSKMKLKVKRLSLAIFLLLFFGTWRHFLICIFKNIDIFNQGKYVEMVLGHFWSSLVHCGFSWFAYSMYIHRYRYFNERDYPWAFLGVIFGTWGCFLICIYLHIQSYRHFKWGFKKNKDVILSYFYSFLGHEDVS